MTESAAEKKKREAQEKARAKAQADKKAAEDAKQAEIDAKTNEDVALKQKEAEEASKAAAKKAKELDDQEDEVEANDEEYDPLHISTVHDEVETRLLSQGSTKEARDAEKANYEYQQELQKQLETDTQRGLGYAGVRSDASK